MVRKPEKTQIDKFRDTARQHEADESETKFNDALKRVAKAATPLTREAKKPEKQKN